MNIVLICDKNYLVPTRALINSIAQNMQEEEEIFIYVIGVGLTLTDFDSIMRLQNDRILIKPIIPEDYFEQIKISHWYVSKAALYKFMIPELINVDKILYLDSDMLVLGSLKSLYETDLKDMYAAVVPDMVAEVEYQFQLKHKIPHYFNSGMMLLNLKELREQGMPQKFISIRRNDKSNLFMDQDTFNKAFNSKVIYVSPKYNYMFGNREHFQYRPEDIASFYNLGIEEMERIIEHPVILHFTDRKKPWKCNDAGKKCIWYQYAFSEDLPQIVRSIVSLWKEENEVLKLQNETLNSQLSNQIFKSKQQEENILFYKNYRRFDVNDLVLSGVMEKIWEARKDISDYLNQCDKEHELVIYGAGRMGQSVFKCLWFLNYADRVAAFVVKDKKGNVDRLYEKNIYDLESYENRNAMVIIAVKDISESEIQQLFRNKNYKEIFEISKMFK